MSVIIGYHVPPARPDTFEGKATGTALDSNGEDNGKFTVWFQYQEDDEREVSILEFETDRKDLHIEDVEAAIESNFYNTKVTFL